MVPLYLEHQCLECHNREGDSVNVIRGGLSVFLPAEKILSATRKNHLKLAVAGTGLIFLTTFTLFILMRRFVIKPLKKLEDMTDEISKGNLDARVEIETGDELEKLGQRFNTMAESLLRGRGQLEEKIIQATKELSDANRELQTLDKLKSDFLANMSHELRTPLTVVRGGIDYLNRTIKKEDNRNYLKIIDKNLARLIHLVTDLFDFTKIEARKIEWSFDQVNLSVLTVPSAGINKPEGTGLGLAICKAIIEAHDGKIWAESVKGRSSTFYFSLLKKRPQPSEPDPPSDLV
jgi:signal transduction histidine kinase